MLDGDGERRMLGSFNDVTDLKRAEALLREENLALGKRVEDRTQERDRICSGVGTCWASPTQTGSG